MTGIFPDELKETAFKDCSEVKEINGALVGLYRHGDGFRALGEGSNPPLFVVLEAIPETGFRISNVTHATLDSMLYAAPKADSPAILIQASTYSDMGGGGNNAIRFSETSFTAGKKSRNDGDISPTELRRKFSTTYAAVEAYTRSFPLAQQGDFKVGKGL